MSLRVTEECAGQLALSTVAPMSTHTTTVGAEFAVPEITDEARAERLTTAGADWATRIDRQRSAAHLTFRVDGTGVGAVATQLRAGSHAFLIDEPAALAGDDVAPSPVEVALGSLIGCQVVVYRLYAQALGIRVDDIRVRAEGDLDAARLLGKDPSVRPGFSAVRLHVELTGPESLERYEALREAVDANCPVLDLFENPTPVEVTVSKG